MIITEYELRANWHKEKPKVITVPKGSVITPAARDFLRDKGIQIQIEGNGIMDLHRSNYCTTVHSMISDRDGGEWKNHMRPADPGPEATASAKPEHMTHLYGNTLVSKNHPVIALRGQLDLFQCELVETELWLREHGEQELADQIEEIASFARQIMTAEVRQQPLEMKTLIGYTAEELRQVSHHPRKYLGVGHTHLSAAQGSVAIRLHRLRAKARQVELYACRAFIDEKGNCSRKDIVMALNRLSSAFYILACKARAKYEKGL